MTIQKSECEIVIFLIGNFYIVIRIIIFLNGGRISGLVMCFS